MVGCGIDAGSRAMKVVLVDLGDRRVVAAAHADQRPDQKALAAGLVAEALQAGRLGLSDIAGTVATGYGRHLVEAADVSVTEISCQARGVVRLAPGVRTIVDIGGQDSKVIFLDGRGVRDFAMNDRCAAGTGQFIEMAARRLGYSLEEVGRAAAGSRRPAAITSTCAVFAETEIISLLAGGTAPEDVAAGVLRSIAQRVASLAVRGLAGPVAFTGGTARIVGMDVILSEAVGQPLVIPPEPHLTAALGAALLACERAQPSSS
jgi:predicted CoA-substrate-specific enzyme activase